MPINDDKDDNEEDDYDVYEMNELEQLQSDNTQILALLEHENNKLHQILTRVLKNRASRKLIRRSIKILNKKKIY